ncbi:glycosyltransferase [Luteolibacter sp. GHJ8]|uniref:Glycosyltransferase n=1 Tax=Luteolibacter rhizosphaerae TaxID=2989719 RepID=A0ABT3FYP4_9BACT|nr:glycosyltransferase [Luteolibacter rhizosphaerae]MCW1912693.1 glycosyltransferase [Luteolibacter rhizosphaerae]
MSRPLRWLTCAPRDYCGNDAYFSRDTGLLCRGLQDAGADCRPILAGEPRPDDAADLVRATASELSDPRWWKGLSADAVVIHTWSQGEHTRTLRAIREAGLRLVLIQDGTGTTGPLGTWGDWVAESWYFRHRHGGSWGGLLWFAARMLHGHTLRLPGFEKTRAQQFELADRIVVPSPRALGGYRKLAGRLGPDLSSRLHLLPYPVAAWFTRREAVPKENLIVSVGRWTDHWQKRPDLLARALEQALLKHPEWRAEIFGEPGSALSRWHANLESSLRVRVSLAGIVSNHQLSTAMARAKISFCSSAYESFHIASGEALCSGASIVGVDSAMTPSMAWFASEQSGSLSETLSGDGLVKGLCREISEWAAGRRDPDQISRDWSARLHAAAVARNLIEMVSC